MDSGNSADSDKLDEMAASFGQWQSLSVHSGWHLGVDVDDDFL